MPSDNLTTFLSHAQNRHRWALGCVFGGKFCGMAGVTLGFVPGLRVLGGVLLVAAFILIGAAVTLMLIQGRHDRVNFEREDELERERKRLRELRRKIDEETKKLESKRMRMAMRNHRRVSPKPMIWV